MQKTIKRYLIFATLIIVTFGFVYCTIIIIDISNTLRTNSILLEEIKEYSNDKKSKEYVDKFKQLDVKFKEESHISNISLNYLKSNSMAEILKKYFFDSIYFRSVTFFTIGYGDFCPNGIVKLIVIIEGFLGTGLAPIFIALSITAADEENHNYQENEEKIKLRIKRGENIVGIFDEGNKYTKIIIMDNLGIVHKYFLKDINNSFKILITEFQIQYYFNDTEYNKDLFYAFAVYIKTLIEDIPLKEPIHDEKLLNYNEFSFEVAKKYFKELNYGLKNNQCKQSDDYEKYLKAQSKVEYAYNHLCNLKY